MTSSKNISAIFALTNLKQGDSQSGTVTITNSARSQHYSVTESAVVRRYGDR